MQQPSQYLPGEWPPKVALISPFMYGNVSVAEIHVFASIEVGPGSHIYEAG
jgi:hypothetical protein